MTLSNLCGNNKTIPELLGSTVKELAAGGFGWAIVKKTAAAVQPTCNKVPSYAEKIASAVSINCATNTTAINVVEVDCDCLNCASEMDCNTADLTIEQRGDLAMVYTTDGEWAFRLLNITV